MPGLLSNKNKVDEGNQEEGSLPDLGSRLEWIVAFVQNESAPLEEEQALRAFQQKLGAYLKGIHICCQGGDHGGPHVMVPGEPVVPDELPMRGDDDRKPLDDKLVLIRAALRRVLKEFLHYGSMPVPLTAEVTLRCMLKQQEGKKELQEEWIANDLPTALRFRLLKDLSTADNMLRECLSEGCGKFLVRHYRKEFCSPLCRNRTNVRKCYQRKKDSEGEKPKRKNGPFGPTNVSKNAKRAKQT